MSLVPVGDKFARGFPDHQEAEEGGCTCGEDHELLPLAYTEFGDVCKTPLPIDAHFFAYSLPGVPRRLAGDEALALSPSMVLFVVDVDVPGHGEVTQEWWDVERSKLAMLSSAHPGFYAYATTHGYRVVYAIDPGEVDSPAARDAWKASYESWLDYLCTSFGIEGDRHCSDWTRAYRLPRVRRDGVDVIPLHELGDPSALGTWDRPFVDPPSQSEHAPYVPTEDGPTDAVIAEVRRRLAKHGPAVSGQGGNSHTRTAWGILVHDWALPEEVARAELLRWNETCDPPWDETDLFEGPARDAQGWHSAYGAARTDWENQASLRAMIEAQLPPDPDPAPEEENAPGLYDVDKLVEDLLGIAMAWRHSDRPAAPGEEFTLRQRGENLRMVLSGGILTDDKPATKTLFDIFEHSAILGYDLETSCSVAERVRPRPYFIGFAATAHQRYYQREVEPKSDGEVQGLLSVTDKGKFESSMGNIVMVLRFGEATRGLLWNDVVSKKIGAAGKFRGAPEGMLDTELRVYLSSRWGISAHASDVTRALSYVATKWGSRDLLREYLRGVVWDGTPRLGSVGTWTGRDDVVHDGDPLCDGWLRSYCAAETKDRDDSDVSDLVTAIGSKWMISAVARALEPGCQVDTVLVMEGAQGLGKSTAFKILGSPWYSGTPVHIGNKDAYLQVQALWICELAELASATRAEVGQLKAFITNAEDNFRPPYGTTSIMSARRCVFGGTINPDPDGEVDYLRDDSGERRWWPVRIGDIDRKRLASDRDQLWAEAVVRFDRGERWWFDRKEQLEVDKVTSNRKAKSAWGGIIRAWCGKCVEGRLGSAVKAHDRWRVEEIAQLALEIPIKEIPRHVPAIKSALRGAGFVERREWEEGGARPRLWTHPELSVPKASDKAAEPRAN